VSENDAQSYRDANLLNRLESVGCRVFDEGDISIPSYLPHHDIPPIKNWPGPRIVWDCIGEHITPLLQQPGHIPLLIGADCSIVVGTTQALMRVRGENVHLVYIDGDIDGTAPDAGRCHSAAAMALWLTTQDSPFRIGPSLKPSQVTIIGWTVDLQSTPLGLQTWSLADVRRSSPDEVAQQVLQAIPASASILVHFDIDVINKMEMPAAYFPHIDGLHLDECRELLSTLLADDRVQLIEVTEYATLRDIDQTAIIKIIDLLTAVLKS
jgi:arginase family enzyme